MDRDLHRLIESATALGAAAALESLGLSSGELSQTRAAKVYGAWFKEAVAQGRIRPCRIEAGHKGTHFFRVTDILTLKTADAAKATLL